jgi:site-specific recombinase
MNGHNESPAMAGRSAALGPTRERILEAFPPERRSHSDVGSLAAALAAFIGAGDLAARLDAITDLREWVAGRATHTAAGDTPRLETLLTLLESHSELRAAFQQGVRQILTETRSVELFAEAGLHPHEGLWSEAARRFIEWLLPSARADTDLAKLVFRLYPTDAAIEQLIGLDDRTFERIARVIAPPDDADEWARQRADLTQALFLLSVHVAGIGLSPDLRARSHPGSIEDSPFYQQQLSTRELVQKQGAGDVLAGWRATVARCRSEMEYVHQRMEDTGVSTALVFDMGTIERAIARMESIAEVLFDAERPQLLAAVKRLLDDVMHARRSDLSVRALFSENSALLARKIVDRTGKTGEHYIANSRAEYRTLWRASLGGGLLTVLTAAIKLRIGEAALPPFVAAVAAGTNYAVSFIVLQHLHLALATKQPSVTAAAFARIVRDTRGQARLERLVDFISHITRSQLGSAAGNLLAVCVGCLAFARLWHWVFARPYLEVHSAAYVYAALSPFASGTVIFATLTGVILWISALAGGWLENLATFNHLPAAIAQHPLGRKLGRERMKRLADFVDRNLSGWTTSIVLGYLLGFVPALGAFFGLPLDVRHVTLSTGTLALAAASFGRDWLYRGWLIHSLIGIAVVFVLNLGVSFSIAAAVAFRAYGVSWAEQVGLIRYTVWSFLRSPLRFLFPPAREQ